MNFPIGIQLYSVRDAMEKDFEGTLAYISEIGYNSVEFAGFWGYSAEDVKTLLNKYNLKVSSTHSPLDDLINKYDETVAFHKTIGNKNYIIPWYDLSDQKKLDYFIENVNVINKKLAEDGITLAYHNHAQEFIMNPDGSVAFEQLLYRTNIMLEVDTYWAFVGMKNPPELLDRIHDRVHFVHIKDGTANSEGKPLGMGEAPVKDVVAKCSQYGFEMVVESETCTPDGPTEAKICIDYLRSL